MNRNQTSSNWQQMTGKNKEKLCHVSPRDINILAMWRNQLARLLQRRYGYAKQWAETELTALGAGPYRTVQYETEVQNGIVDLVIHDASGEADRARFLLQ